VQTVTKSNGAPAVIIPGAVYTSPEAAELLRVKVSTICRAKRQGKINAEGRPLRIMGSELIRFALAGGAP
jgi:hypothetical protein